MTWNEYTTLLIPLRQKYGSNFYSNEHIKQAFNYWQHKQKNELIELLNQIFSSNVKQSLIIHTLKENHKHVKTYVSKENITEGFLERYLAMHNCSSIEDLLKKEIAKLK